MVKFADPRPHPPDVLFPYPGVSSDGHWIAFVVARAVHANNVTFWTALGLLQPDTGEIRRVPHPPNLTLSKPKFCDGDRKLLCLACEVGSSRPDRVLRIDIVTGATETLYGPGSQIVEDEVGGVTDAAVDRSGRILYLGRWRRSFLEDAPALMRADIPAATLSTVVASIDSGRLLDNIAVDENGRVFLEMGQVGLGNVQERKGKLARLVGDLDLHRVGRFRIAVDASRDLSALVPSLERRGGGFEVLSGLAMGNGVLLSNARFSDDDPGPKFSIQLASIDVREQSVRYLTRHEGLKWTVSIAENASRTTYLATARMERSERYDLWSMSLRSLESKRHFMLDRLKISSVFFIPQEG